VKASLLPPAPSAVADGGLGFASDTVGDLWGIFGGPVGSFGAPLASVLLLTSFVPL
jgi:hypothetical protein